MEPTFGSRDEEVKYWKAKALEWEQKSKNIEAEFDELQESSSMIEKELEKAVEQLEHANKELKIKCNRLTFDLDFKVEKCAELEKENAGYIRRINQLEELEQKRSSYVRELEQKNDDIERLHRNVMETVKDIQTQLDSQIEKNALLETELDEKEELQTVVQRLKDEHRDLQQELQRQLRQRFPDNERVRSPIDSNKLAVNNELSSLHQQTTAPVKSMKMRASLPRCATHIFRSPVTIAGASRKSDIATKNLAKTPPKRTNSGTNLRPTWNSSPDLSGGKKKTITKHKPGFFRRVFKKT